MKIYPPVAHAMARIPADLIITNAAELLMVPDGGCPRTGPAQGNLGIVRDGAVAVADGRIIGTGRTRDVLAGFTGERLDATGRVVMPGFVDPHTHLVFGGSREHEYVMKLEGKSYMEIMEAGGGIFSTVRATRAASEDELVAQARRRLDRMLTWGTTTVEAKSGYGLTVEDELKCLRAALRLGREHPVDIVSTFLGAHAVPEGGDADAYIDILVHEAVPRIAAEGLAEFCDVFCEKGVFSVDQSRRLLNAAAEAGLAPKLHADELSQLGGSELAAEVGAVSADHLLMASDAGIWAMAREGVIGVLLPGTPFVLRTEYPRARYMVEQELPLALATDLNPNCLTEGMPLMVALACVQMRMLPAEAIVAATLNAAYAINRADEVGSLDIGKKADMIVLDAPNHIHLPYHFGVNLVDTVIKEGVVVREGQTG